ncbi:glycosyltransferase family 2 protein [Blastococcus sp. CT_GayMR16]|uniref:glycosyltransferase n=1 Tax=Blastococcus sp. CT_GayMR16 TaxID=2559607 RepID=UPI001ADD6276|nr:glycosyltransferase family 2 protein [Blastococcus sp. CT_GayMR16]
MNDSRSHERADRARRSAPRRAPRLLTCLLGTAGLVLLSPSVARAAVEPAARVSESGLDAWAVAGLTFLVLVSLFLTAVAVTTVAWMLHAWRSPQSLAATGFSGRHRLPERTFSLLVPARHEEGVLGDTLDALAALQHPRYEVIAIVGHDDPGTDAVARAAAARHPSRVRVVVDDSVPKNKPKALNRALQECRGDVVGVFDAEDDVHPQLLRLIDNRFTETGADVVQGGVQLMNMRTSWWSLRNCMEYYFWFRSRLHFHAQARFIPLGGNTVFIRTALIRDAGGWDAECLAEDCEIGVRLSTNGARVVVAYDPEVATREETPGSLKSLYKQRTRWNQGFLQVLRKGEWRRLPTFRQRLMARYLLTMPFLQAATGVMIPISVLLMLTAKVPTPIALLTFLPLAPTVVSLVVEVAGLGDFGRVYGMRIRMRDYARLLLGSFPYQVFLAAAAIRSVVRELRGDGSWEKTEHSNVHRSLPVVAQLRPQLQTANAVSLGEREAV